MPNVALAQQLTQAAQLFKDIKAFFEKQKEVQFFLKLDIINELYITNAEKSIEIVENCINFLKKEPGNAAEQKVIIEMKELIARFYPLLTIEGHLICFSKHPQIDVLTRDLNKLLQNCMVLLGEPIQPERQILYRELGASLIAKIAQLSHAAFKDQTSSDEKKRLAFQIFGTAVHTQTYQDAMAPTPDNLTSASFDRLQRERARTRARL